MEHEPPTIFRLPKPQTPPVYSDLSSDPDMADLVEMFVDHLGQRVEALREAVELADNDALEELAYQLKGSAGGYGFEPITELASIIEKQARDHADIDQLRDAVDDLVNICGRVTADPPPYDRDPLPPAA